MNVPKLSSYKQERILLAQRQQIDLLREQVHRYESERQIQRHQEAMRDEIVERKEREVNQMRQECTRLKMMMAEEKVRSGITSAVNESNSK